MRKLPPLTKEAVAVEQLFDKRVRQPSFPSMSNKPSAAVKLNDATLLANAMHAAARHGALDNTRVDFNGTRLNDIEARVKANPRNSESYKADYENPYGMEVDNFGEGEGRFTINEDGTIFKSFEGPTSVTTQSLPDAYHPTADNVWLPSGNPGVMMHELGHAIDYNEYPKDSPFRRTMASAYQTFSPSLWQEHAAWRKGRDRLLAGAAKTKLNPALLTKTLEQAARLKPMGLGSYWGSNIGGALGTVTGGAIGLAGLPLLAYAMGARQLPVSGQLTGLGAVVGGLAGAVTGGNLGASWGKSYGEREALGNEQAIKKYMDEYASAYSIEHNVPKEEALRQIEALRETIKAKVKNKQTSKDKSMGRLSKAAAFGAMMGKQAAVKHARRSGELGPIGSGILVGSGLGALGGGLIGAINPGFSEELETEGPASKRRFYRDEHGTKQPYYVDDDGNLLYKRRGLLSGAFHGGVTGLGWGGLAGGIIGGLSGVANASNPRPSPDFGTTPPSSGSSTSAPSAPDLGGLNPDLTLKPNTSINLSLRPYLEDAYKNVPGGLDKAVSSAQDYQDAAKGSGLITWKPSAIDKIIPVTNRPSEWPDKYRNSDTLGGVTRYPILTNPFTGAKSRADGKIMINPFTRLFDSAGAKMRTIRHELTHGALHDGADIQEPVLSLGDQARTGAPLDQLKYVLQPEEFKAHLAEIKREIAKNTGVLIDTPAKAKKALEDAGRNPGNDILRQNLPKLMKNKSLSDKAILQLLSIVKGGVMKPQAGGYA